MSGEGKEGKGREKGEKEGKGEGEGGGRIGRGEGCVMAFGGWTPLILLKVICNSFCKCFSVKHV